MTGILTFHDLALSPGWKKKESHDPQCEWVLYYAGWIKGSRWTDLAKQLYNCDSNKVKSLIIQLKGEFGFFFESQHLCCAVVDHILSYPISVVEVGRSRVCYTNDRVLAADGILRTSPLATAVMRLGGYAVGNGTLYQNADRIPAGTCLLSNSINVDSFQTQNSYPGYVPRKAIKSDDVLEATYEAFNFSLFENCDKKIAIPLSAGYDSRVVLSVLKSMGYKNIVSYSYGTKGNSEARVAAQLAAAAGIEWVFVETNPQTLRKFFNTEEFLNFREVTSDGISGPIYHDLYVTGELLRRGILDADTVIINGNSGDFISGGHLPIFLTEPNPTSANLDTVVTKFVNKHFALWDKSGSSELDAIIWQQIRKQFLLYCDPNDIESVAYAWERIEYENRQQKNVIKRQKIYDYYQLTWRLPLWSPSYINFWNCVGLEQKRSQFIYKYCFESENISGLWKKIPLNKNKFISPPIFRWIIRPVCKFIIGGLFGRTVWWNFEKRFLCYYTDNSGLQSIYSYFEVIRRPTFRNYIALHVEDYLRWREK